MNKLRKLLSSVLALAMIFGVIGTANVSAALPPDMENNSRAEAVETLGALGIMVGDAETGLFRPNEAIKRSEVAKIAVAALGLTDVAESSNYPTKYPDVVSDHWANGYINVATNQKLVIGDDTGAFRPDDTITYAEAMTILVRVLGHEPSALSKGGYPAGFLVVGTENNLNRNAVAATNEPATRSLVAQMMFNALTVKMMEQTGYGDKLEYSVVDKTLLKNKLHTTKITGQVTATNQSGINSSSSLKKDEVQIGDTVYQLGDIDAANFLGYNVVAYLKEDDHGDEHIILIWPEETKNSSLNISADNFESLSDESARKVLKYWKDKENDKKESEAYINNDAKLIYNGKYETLDNALINLKDKAGHVNLLDTDRDGKYDFVFVTEYSNVVVEEVMPSSGKIIDKYGAPTITLDPDDDDLDFRIEKAGEIIEVKDLAEWDVLSVAASKDKSVYRIIAVRNAVEGKVTEIQDDKIKVDGTLYKIAANYTQKIALEDEGTFYLDVEGKIAAVDASSTVSSNYAYLMNAAKANNISDNVELKLFTKAGETVVITAADKVRINGVSGKNAAELLSALSDSSGNIVNQLITFEQNSAGKLVSIHTAKDNTSTGAVDKNNFTKNLVLTNAVYKTATGKVGNVNVDKNTIVFDIPAGSTDSDDYAIRNGSMFENDTPYNAIVFDMSEDYTAKAMIVTNTDYKANAESSVAVVTEITSIKNDQNVIVDKLYAVQDGKKVELLTSEKGLLVKDGSTELEKGDIIQYKTNAKGEISAVRVLLDISKKDTQFSDTPATDLEILYGRVTAKFAGSMNLKVNDEAERNIIFGDAKIYVVDSSKNNNIVTQGTTGEIQKFDDADPYQVFVKIYKDAVQEIVVVKL